MKFKSDIEVQAGLKDSSGSVGSSGQILTSTGTQTFWATMPITPGTGGSSQVFYFNGSIASSVAGYQQMSPTAYIGIGTDFSINANGYIASFLTDVNSPNQLNIPAGNWNFEIYMSSNPGPGSPSFYVELYKYSSSTFTLIASSSATPEGITNGTAIDLYITALAVPATVLTVTDRLAVRVYVLNSGRTITMHTQDSHLSEVITTFSTGISALNGLTPSVQYFATNGSGVDFNIVSSGSTHAFNLPTASGTNRGALSSTDWNTFNGKQTALNGTGFVKISGTTISYDNSTYYLASNPSGYISSVPAQSFASLTGKPTTLSGYGIVDAYPLSGNPSGFISTVNGTAITPSSTNGVSAIVMAYNDATSSIQTQLNSKALDSNVVHLTGNETLSGVKTFSSGLVGTLTGYPTQLVTANSSDNADHTFVLAGTVAGYPATPVQDNNFTINPVTHAVKNNGTIQATSFNSTLGSNFATSSGNVGIGTTTPQTKLTVGLTTDTGTITTSLMYLAGYNNATNQLRYMMNHNSGYNAGIGTLSTGGLIFGHGNIDGTIVTEYMRMATTGAATFASSITAGSIIKSGGTSVQFLKADGSVDSSTYALTSQLHDAVTLGASNGLSLSTQVLSLGLSSTSTTGSLSSTNWNTFNQKFTLPAFQSGSVLFASGTTIGSDNASFFWDSINKRLGIGTATPVATQHTLGTTLQQGNIFFSQPVPTALVGSTTLTIAQLLTGIITANGSAPYTFTLPTGTLTDAGTLSGGLPVNNAFEWTLINLSAIYVMSIAAGVGHTIVGSTTTAISGQSTWRTTKTASNTFATYRVY